MSAHKPATEDGARTDGPDLGLPQYDALTIEGRIERVGMAADHLTRSRRGLERPLRRSQWRFGLQLILLAIAAVVVLALLLQYV